MGKPIFGLEALTHLALQLSVKDRVLLIKRLAASISTESNEPPLEDVEPLTNEEIAEMLRPEPMTGAEIVAAELTGGWADLGITDGAKWVQEQHRKRREKRGG